MSGYLAVCLYVLRLWAPRQSRTTGSRIFTWYQAKSMGSQ